MWQIINKSCHTSSQKNIFPSASTWMGKQSSVVHVLAVNIINVLTILLGGNPQLLCCLSVLLSEGPAFVTLFSEAVIILPLVHQLILLMLQSCSVSLQIILAFAIERKN